MVTHPPEDGQPEHPDAANESGGEAPPVDGTPIPLVEFDVPTAAARAHAHWLTSGNREYSPHNKPWDELTHEAQFQISRSTRIALEHAAERVRDALGSVEIVFIDLEQGQG